MFTPKLSQVLGQSVIIENIPARAASVGTQKAADARPDGYTVLIINVTHTATEALYKNLGYSLIDSFDPVLRFRTLLRVRREHEGRSEDVPRFVDFAKAHPGELNYSSAGLGSPTFMATALLNSAAGLDMAHIPYEGGGQGVASIVAGETDFYAAPYTTAKPFFEDGKLRPLAVSSPRSALLPARSSPCLRQGARIRAHLLVRASLPKGTPVEIRDKIRAAMVERSPIPP